MSDHNWADGKNCYCDSCKVVHRHYQYKWRQERNDFLNHIKSESGCVICGFSNPIALDFDHRDPSDKLPIRWRYHSLTKVISEINKCDIKCANCHRIHTYTQEHFKPSKGNSTSYTRIKVYRQKRKLMLDRIKIELGCIDCGFDNHPVALDFDHKDPSTKTLKDWQTASLEKILIEIAKCEVRCANCHRIRTANEKHYTNSYGNMRLV